MSQTRSFIGVYLVYACALSILKGSLTILLAHLFLSHLSFAHGECQKSFLLVP
nr:MAG TPA: hypothetical protein [Caudoviricetes sp.]